jgi:putative DNA primase/helicase
LRASFTALGQGVARWVQDHADALQQQDPAIPEQLHDRAADNWSPLLAIADTIGGEWPEKARTAAVAISGNYECEDDSIRIQLLSDVRTVFGESKKDQLSSQDMCDRLVAMEEKPWASWKRGHPITPVQLAKLFRPFEIRSRDIWKEEHGVKRCVKGYVIDDFKEAFDRYLQVSGSPSKQGVLKREAARVRSSTGHQADCQSARTGIPRASKSTPITAPDQASRVLADQNGGSRQKAIRQANFRKLGEVFRRVKATPDPDGVKYRRNHDEKGGGEKRSGSK